MSSHLWPSEKAISSLSMELIGIDLAKKVAAKLINDADKSGIWNSHRDYCGHGLAYIQQKFCLIEVYDGYISDSGSLKSWGSTEEFVHWLANLSDYSLSGTDHRFPELFTKDSFKLNNQRLTEQRLEEYIASS